jgi:hypothetical protein
MSASILLSRVSQPDLINLPEWQVADVLNAPDPALPLVAKVFSCRDIAEPAVLSGELEMLRIVKQYGHIPADVAPGGQAIQIPTPGLIAIGTMLDAVDRQLSVDPSVLGGAAQVLAMLEGIEAIGLLSAATKAAILAGTVRVQSWAEANGIEVTARTIGLAKGAN